MNDRINTLIGERTLVLIKPDAVRRGLIGPIIQRFEQVGLKIVAAKMVMPDREILEGHFPTSEGWIRGLGEKTLESYREYGISPFDVFDTDDALEIGHRIREWNFDYLGIGPVMVMVLEGLHAIQAVRKMIGNTLPYKAEPGTIRGDYSINAPDLANIVGSAVKNVIHASGSVEEATQEVANWFSPDEILSWERTDEFLHFVRGEFTV